MRVAVFSTKPFDKMFLEQYNVAHKHTLVFFEQRLRLTELSARLVAGFSAVCVFANDVLNRTVLTILSENRVRLIALRCAGFNNVDLVIADIEQGPAGYSW